MPAAPKLSKKLWTHLQTYHEDEEYQSEVLQESKRLRRTSEANVSGKDAGKEYEGDTE